MANLQTFPIRATFCSKLFREKKYLFEILFDWLNILLNLQQLL